VASSISDADLALLESAALEVAAVASAADARALAREARALARRVSTDGRAIAIGGFERKALGEALARSHLARRFHLIEAPDRLADGQPVDLTLFAVEPTHGLTRDDLEYLASVRCQTRALVVVAPGPDGLDLARRQLARVAPSDAIEIVSRCQLDTVWPRIEACFATRTSHAVLAARRAQVVALVLRLRGQLDEQRAASSTWLETSKRRTEQLAGWALAVDHVSHLLAPLAAQDLDRLRERLEAARVKFLMAVKVDLLEGLARDLDEAAPARAAYRSVALTLAHELVLDAITRWHARIASEIETTIERSRDRFSAEIDALRIALPRIDVAVDPAPPFSFRAESPAARASLTWATDGMRTRAVLRRAAIAEAREVTLRLLTANSRDVIEEALARAHDEYSRLVLGVRRASRELADASADAVRRVSAARAEAVPEPIDDLLAKWLHRLGELERGLAAVP